MNYIFLLALLFLFSCNKENKATQANTSSQRTQVKPLAKDDFSDLKKDDESCDTEEDLEKKIMEEAKKKPNQAFKLQGGDTGCDGN